MSQITIRAEEDTPVLVDCPVAVVPMHVWNRLLQFKERAEMKLTQLESTEYDDFGGVGTGEDKANRAAYIKVLKWLLGKV